MTNNQKEIDSSVFWRLIVPILCLFIVLGFLLIVYGTPDWFLDTVNSMSEGANANSTT